MFALTLVDKQFNRAQSHAFHRVIVTLCVMMVAIIEVLDMTIVNVTLPDMMGQLGANVDQITWVLTSYIISAAILMPLTGLLIKRFGVKYLLLLNILGFLIASILCGLSSNLSEIVFFRVLQGLFGASLVPLSQFILREIYTEEEQGMAMAIWGIGIMTAPVLGPTLGGYIAEHWGWRWVFFINIPVCIGALLLSFYAVQDTPHEQVSIDWLGLCLMAVGIGTLQTWLDRGNTENWLDSNFILVLVILSIVFLILFIIRGCWVPNSIVNLKIFRNRHFSVTTVLLMGYCFATMGTLALQPLMLETLFGYPSSLAGLLMAPRGVFSAISMFISGQLIKKVGVRWLLGAGLLFSTWGNELMSSFNLQTDFYSMIEAGVVQGLGMGLFFVPASTIVMKTLDQSLVGEASGLFSFGRSMGSSLGISGFSTVLSRESQINWQHLIAHIHLNNFNLNRWLNLHHIDHLHGQSAVQMVEMVHRQAEMIGFLNAYHFSSLSYLLLLPLLLLL